MAEAAGYQFEYSGGELCLDFANTLGDRPRGHEEHLAGWPDVIAWSEQARVISTREAAALRSAGGRGAGRAFTRAIALRECLYRVFAALAAGRTPARDDVEALNRFLRDAIPHARVVGRTGGFAWGWSDDGPPADRLLWPVVRSAADLLVSAERSGVRECASGTCSWLFVDRSRTRKRRWCSMKTCGNRAKVRRFYARHLRP